MKGIITFLLLTVLVSGILSPAAYAEKKVTVTVKDNQLFLGDTQITKSSCGKSMAVVSPDNRKVAFWCTFAGSACKLGIVDTQTGREERTVLDEEYTQVMNIEWLNDDTVGVNIHINPNTDMYVLYDGTARKPVNKYFGTSFIHDKSGVFYLQGQMGDYAVMRNDFLLYKPGEHMKTRDLCLSPDFGRAAFYLYDAQDSSKSAILVLTLGPGTVKSTAKIPWNRNVDDNELKWDNNQILSIGKAARYDAVKSRLMRNKG